MNGKKWYESKTLWWNLIGIVAIGLQYIYGAEVIDAEGQMAILAVINLILRLITTRPITR